MKNFREFFRVEQLPVFQNRMFNTRQEAIQCTKGDIVLVEDEETGLCYNSVFNPELMTYGGDYQNEQAVSSVFKNHLQDVTGIVQKNFNGQSLVEVGCGKGYFLERLLEAKFSITGFDPTYEGSNPAVVKKYFTPEVEFRADGIILRHVLEHVQDPYSFLQGISNSNGGQGKIYIEVPCFDWICQHRAWFDVFYEHVNYFRLSDFHRMFGTVQDSGLIFGGQYIYVVADLKTLRKPIYDSKTAISFPKDFTASINKYSLNKQATVWGGASKGVTFSIYMQRAGCEVSCVIDINPAKQGKFIGVTGIQIVSPEQGLRDLKLGSDIFVMNGNYIDEIRAQTKSLYNLIKID